MHRVAGWCALVYAVVNPVALLPARRQHAEPPLTASASRLTLVGLLRAGAARRRWFLARPRWTPRCPGWHRHAGLVDGLQLVFFVAVISRVTVAAGGPESWQWLFLVFVIVLAAVSLSFAWTAALGLLSVIGFLVTAAVTGTATADQPT